MIFSACCGVSSVVMLTIFAFFITHFMEVLPSFYKVLSFKGKHFEKMKIKNGFQAFISMRGPMNYIYSNEDYTFVIHYRLCIGLLFTVIFNLISVALFMVLAFYNIIVLLIFNVLISALVLFGHLFIAIYIHIKNEQLLNQQ